jgi:hypothetical protein
MSTDSSRPRRRREHELMRASGHYPAQGMTILVIASIAGGNITWHKGLPGLAASVGFGLGIAWFMISSFSHDRGLCERCIREAPGDPQRAVSRSMLVLRWWHRNRVRAGIILAGVSWFVVAGHLWTRSQPAGFLAGEAPWAWWVGNAVMTWIAVDAWVAQRHRALSPWCPLCRWGGRGDDEEVAAPKPDPAMSR